jgi:hypothetical protein
VVPHASAGAGTEGRARGKRAGAHAEARAERRRNVTEEIAAARAVAITAEGSGGVGAEPAAAGRALRIDTLHRETGQELHFPPQWPQGSGRFLRDRPTVGRFAAAIEKVLSSPGRTISLPCPNRKKTACQRLRLKHKFGTRGNSGRDGADSDANALWCQEKRLQDIVVRLRGSSDW